MHVKLCYKLSWHAHVAFATKQQQAVCYTLGPWAVRMHISASLLRLAPPYFSHRPLPDPCMQLLCVPGHRGHGVVPLRPLRSKYKSASRASASPWVLAVPSTSMLKCCLNTWSLAASLRMRLGSLDACWLRPPPGLRWAAADGTSAWQQQRQKARRAGKPGPQGNQNKTIPHAGQQGACRP